MKDNDHHNVIVHSMRLNQFISKAGVCSRRKADVIIQAGKINVDGQLITKLGYKVMPNAVVMYGNKVLKIETFIYILMNKPAGYVTTTKDPEGRQTVLHLISKARCTARIYPVGRLDYHTTGLLLLTNDGNLAGKLAHPRSNVKKVYHIILNQPLSQLDFEKIQTGVLLHDGYVQVDALAILSDDRKSIGMELHVGKNRIVRRIFEHFNYIVFKLDRAGYANLTKKNLARGQWRFLLENEVHYLKNFV